MFIAALALLSALTPWGEVDLVNADFEARASSAEEILGWTLSLGAQNGGPTPASRVELDHVVKHAGKSSLHLQGKSSTRGWMLIEQAFPARRGGKYTLSGWGKTEGVKREGIQFNNGYLALSFEDATGNNVGRQYVHLKRPSSEWSALEVSLTAPERASRGKVFAFLSMTGEVWLDDLKLRVEGGESPRPFETVLEEGFEKARSLPSKWKKTAGATSGNNGKFSKLKIDSDGTPDSPRSLKLSGNANTHEWYVVKRVFKAKPGELYQLDAMVRAEDVHQQANQFSNFHLHLVFLDKEGKDLGTPVFASPGYGTYGWKPVSVSALAPLGTEEVQLGIFLSMSGQVWIDEIELQRQAGNPPPYADFVQIEKGGITLHFSSNDPNAKNAKTYLRRLVNGKKAICKQLKIQWKEPIHVFVYADNAKGQLLTGRSLDFADSAGKRVHQQWNSYISHEITHVIVHNSFQDARTGILGEGIAVWLDSRSKNAHHELAARLLDKGELPAISDLLSDFRAQANSYPAAGSFCGWLLKSHGLDTFREIYPLPDPSARAKELTGLSFLDMESAWHAELAKY